MTADTTTGQLLLPCPQCGEPEAAIVLNLCLMNDPGQDCFQCNSCDAEFSRLDVGRSIDRWSSVLAWIGGAPFPPAE